MADPWFTVVGAYADTKDSYLVQVQAEDATAARAAGYRQAEGVVIGLSVFPGRIDVVKEDTTVTPLRGPEHAVIVAHVHVMESRVMIPSRCPTCRSSLRDPRALLCGDLHLTFWNGHLSQDSTEVKGELEQSRKDLPSDLRMAHAARIQCKACLHGFHDVEDRR